MVGFSPYQYGDGAVPYDLGAVSLPTLWKALVDLGRAIVAQASSRDLLLDRGMNHTRSLQAHV